MPEEQARLDERMVALSARLDRAENTCERRAGEHVDRRLYESQRLAMQGELGDLRHRLSEHERKAAEAFAEMRTAVELAKREAAESTSDLARKISRDRQWAVGLASTVLLTLLGYLVAVLT